jgi:hypothetical protein
MLLRTPEFRSGNFDTGFVELALARRKAGGDPARAEAS